MDPQSRVPEGSLGIVVERGWSVRVEEVIVIVGAGDVVEIVCCAAHSVAA